MSITAAMVKELRERTGSGMMECKKALVDCNGDIDAAIEMMRKSGLAKADKRSGKTAAEGLIVVATSGDGSRTAMVEVNCETDFVARGDDFGGFAGKVADMVAEKAPADVEALSALDMGEGKTVDQVRQEMIAKIGENISLRRFVTLDADGGAVASYLHGARIGVLVGVSGGDDGLGRDVAMHVAASKPTFVSADDVDSATLDRERDIFVAQAKDSGKPDNIIEKMVEGRLRKFVNEITLEGQAFVKDPDTTVGKLLSGAGARVTRFERFEVGEGIEKKKENFAEEVMAQVRGE